jgi:hypothetical protein
MLLPHGYNTFLPGQVAPVAVGGEHRSRSVPPLAVGPRLRALLRVPRGETNQWYPDLTQDNASVPQPRTPEDGYHLSEDLADRAIKSCSTPR